MENFTIAISCLAIILSVIGLILNYKTNKNTQSISRAEQLKNTTILANQIDIKKMFLESEISELGEKIKEKEFHNKEDVFKKFENMSKIQLKQIGYWDRTYKIFNSTKNEISHEELLNYEAQFDTFFTLMNEYLNRIKDINLKAFS